MPRKILSLFDHSGNWSKPYRDRGYEVIQVDLKHGQDVLDIDEAWIKRHGPFHGVMAAPPCTHFAISGSRFWKEKDADGRTAHAILVLKHTLKIIRWCGSSLKWYAIENPGGRINQLLPATMGTLPRWSFQPWWYGDPWTKKTWIWGTSKQPPKHNPRMPIGWRDKNGHYQNWMSKYGGGTDKCHEMRSITPMGFSKRFCVANP